MNLAAILMASAARLGGRTALKLDGVELSYRALDAASARVAALLRRRGVEPGDRVGVMLPNVPEFAVVYYGILRAGAVVVPVNVLLKEREVARFLGDSGAGLLFGWHAFAEVVEVGARGAGTDCLFVTPGEFEWLLGSVRPERDLCERDPSDTAVILYTSGTTGTPKGAELTHANLSRNAEAVRALHSLSEHDVTLGALPLFHSFGQTCALNATIGAGGCLSLMERFEAGKALEVIERDGVTVLQAVPTMYAALLSHPARDARDHSTLRVCVSGGAPMPAEVMRGFERAFGRRVVEGYGLSETSPLASSNHFGRHRKPGSIGAPIAGVEMKVVDADGNDLPCGEVGEIVIRGHNVMKGYWRRPEETAAVMRGGWFHTGDLGRADADGYFYVVDRSSDVINRGGYNVYPREVEEVLCEHPGVREAAVVGIPHPVLGEEVAAAVVPRVPAEGGLDLAALREFVKARVAAYKYPRQLWLVEELPRGPTGKVHKREIVVPLEAASTRRGPA